MSRYPYVITLGSAPYWSRLRVLRTQQPVYTTDTHGVTLDEDGMELNLHGCTHVRVEGGLTPEERIELLRKRHPWHTGDKPNYQTVGVIVRHEHLPALNRYTSGSQYEAMQQVLQHRTITPMLMHGHSSKTVGSLLRNAWIKAETYTDESGVVREGWVVTDAGAHAMKMYETKLEEIRKANELRAQVEATRKAKEEELYAAALEYYRAEKIRNELEGKCNAIAHSMISVAPTHEYRHMLQRVYHKARSEVLGVPKIPDTETIENIVNFNQNNIRNINRS